MVKASGLQHQIHSGKEMKRRKVGMRMRLAGITNCVKYCLPHTLIYLFTFAAFSFKGPTTTLAQRTDPKAASSRCQCGTRKRQGTAVVPLTGAGGSQVKCHCVERLSCGPTIGMGSTPGGGAPEFDMTVSGGCLYPLHPHPPRWMPRCHDDEGCHDGL
ncbi:hypothetical protein BDW72DRAFT_99468 [Aspergillus terricola var. indicus]